MLRVVHGHRSDGRSNALAVQIIEGWIFDSDPWHDVSG